MSASELARFKSPKLSRRCSTCGRRVERKLAHLVRWGSRQARYLGERKVGMQLFLVALLANLDRLSRLAVRRPNLIELLVAAN
jgi:IS5 family transposase